MKKLIILLFLAVSTVTSLNAFTFESKCGAIEIDDEIWTQLKDNPTALYWYLVGREDQACSEEEIEQPEQPEPND